MINNWRNNDDPTFFGVPFSGLFAYLLLIYYWSASLFLFITACNAFYAFLHWRGYSPTGMYYKLMSKIRGNIIYSRPWWFREQWSDKE
jgi:intracellular multiplication protein IcmT